MDFTENIQEYLNKEKAVIDSLNIEELNVAMNAIYNAWLGGNIIYTLGNGGSAATASHFVCDFNKGISMNVDRQFNLQCLNDNTPIMMAIANDIGYDDVFYLQLKDRVRPGDLLIAISGSGNSRNVLKACEYAKEQGAKIIGLTGYNGGCLKEIADYSMHVPVDDMQITEDLHMIFDHMMMRVFCEIG